jgi:putative oxidoreductase
MNLNNDLTRDNLQKIGRRPYDLLDAIPFAVIALVARVATFSVFIRSGTQKLSDWSATLMLFDNEYHVPLLPPHLAAYLSVCIEIGCAVMVLLGLGTRIAVAVLFGLISIIQIFIYPEAWPDHIQWFAFMLILLARGPGALSFDALIRRKVDQQMKATPPSPAK